MTDRALRALIDEIRNVVARRLPDQEIADEVAEVLREHRPAPAELLTAEQRRGHPEHYEQHVLHTDDDGSFSIVALVWRPEQRTSIHDHVTWCVVGVLEGTEQEALYKLSESGRPVEAETRVNHSGTVCGFAPPGDIHQVTNAGPRQRDLAARLRRGHLPARHEHQSESTNCWRRKDTHLPFRSIDRSRLWSDHSFRSRRSCGRIRGAPSPRLHAWRAHDLQCKIA